MTIDINNGLKPIRYKLYPFYTSEPVYFLYYIKLLWIKFLHMNISLQNKIFFLVSDPTNSNCPATLKLFTHIKTKEKRPTLIFSIVPESWIIIWLQCQRVVVGVARKQCYRDIAGLLDGRLGIVEEVVGALHPQERVKVHLGTVQDTDLLPGFKRLNW